MDDWQEQIQELQALKAIFEEDFCVPGITGSELTDSDEEFSRLTEATPPPLGLEAQLLVHLSAPSSPFTIQVHVHLHCPSTLLLLTARTRPR